MKCNECAYISFKVAKKCPLCNAKLTEGNPWSQRGGEGFTLSPVVAAAMNGAGVAPAVQEESDIFSLGDEGFGEDFGVEGFSELLETPAKTGSLSEETHPAGDFELDLEDAETLSDAIEPISKHEDSEAEPLDMSVSEDTDPFEVEGLGFEDEIGEDFSDNEINLDTLITPKEPLGKHTAPEVSKEEESNVSDLSFDPEEESKFSELDMAEDSDPIRLDITSEEEDVPNFDPETELSEGLDEPSVNEPLLQIDAEFSPDQEEPDFIDLDNFGETPSPPLATVSEDEVSEDEIESEQADLPQATKPIALDEVEEFEELPEIEIEIEPEIELEIELDGEPGIETEIPARVDAVEETLSAEGIRDSEEVILDPVEEIDDLSMPEVTPVEENSLSDSEDAGVGEDFKFELETDEDWAQKLAVNKEPEEPKIESFEFKLELEPDQSAPLKTLDLGTENVEIEDLGLELEDSDEDAPKPPPAV